VINLSEGLPLIVADPGPIEQIILNLAINARDALRRAAPCRSTFSARDREDEYTSPGIPEGLRVVSKQRQRIGMSRRSAIERTNRASRPSREAKGQDSVSPPSTESSPNQVGTQDLFRRGRRNLDNDMLPGHSGTSTKANQMTNERT